MSQQKTKEVVISTSCVNTNTLDKVPTLIETLERIQRRGLKIPKALLGKEQVSNMFPATVSNKRLDSYCFVMSNGVRK